MIEQQDQWLATLGAAIADRSRIAMLLALMDGRAYTASELARVANVAPATASHHLERLETSGLLTRWRQGRHSYFRLADEHVAALLEQMLATLASLGRREIETRCPKPLRQARVCYNHLAGELGVRLLSNGLARGVFAVHEGEVLAGGESAAFFKRLQLPATAHAGRFCLDWSERRFHLAGPLASAILDAMLARRWLLPGKGRQLAVTEEGKRQLRQVLGG